MRADLSPVEKDAFVQIAVQLDARGLAVGPFTTMRIDQQAPVLAEEVDADRLQLPEIEALERMLDRPGLQRAVSDILQRRA
jgi:hypothetical protein